MPTPYRQKTDNRAMSDPAERYADGVVDWFNDEEGWGAISAPEVPGGCFVHFSNIEASGYRTLQAGARVRFTFEEPGFLQDGYRYRAVTVWPSAT
jgi:CspA family cold shock protein